MADETKDTKTEAPAPAPTRARQAPAKAQADTDLPLEETQIGVDGKRHSITELQGVDPGSAVGGFLYDSGLGSNGPADRESDEFDPKGGGPKAVTQEDVLAAQKADAK